jgi:hypothetical protein
MTSRNRLWVVLRQAAKSDNPTVKSALARLMVATEIAHGEEIAKTMNPEPKTPQMLPTTQQRMADFIKAMQAVRDAGMANTGVLPGGVASKIRRKGKP